MLIRMTLRCFVADASLEASWLALLESAGFVTPFVVVNGVDSGGEFAERLGVPVSLNLQALWAACDRYAELAAVVAFTPGSCCSASCSSCASCASCSGSSTF